MDLIIKKYYNDVFNYYKGTEMRQAGDFDFTGKNGKNYKVNIFDGKKRPAYVTFQRLKAAEDASRQIAKQQEDPEADFHATMSMASFFINIIAERFAKVEPNFFSIERGEIDEYGILSEKAVERMANFLDIDPITLLVRCGVVINEAKGSVSEVQEEQIQEIIRQVEGSNQDESGDKVQGNSETSTSDNPERETPEATPENFEGVSG